MFASWTFYKPSADVETTENVECPEEYVRHMSPVTECYNGLCNSDIAVAVLFSKATLKRHKTGTLSYWPKYAGNMAIIPYGPQPYPEIEGLRSTNTPERTDNQVLDFVVAMWKDFLEKSPGYKWYLKIDDDTFLFAPNFLRKLSEFDSNERILGGKLIYDGFMASGGAGYFFSRIALEMLAKHLDGCVFDFYNSSGRPLDQGGPEDAVVSLCAKKHVPDLKMVNVHGMYPFNPILTKQNSWNFSKEGLLDYPLTLHQLYEKESFLLNHCISVEKETRWLWDR